MAERKYTRQDLESLARQSARAEGLPESLFLGLIDQETGGTWNPRSVGPVHKKWGSAKGLGQLIDDTAVRLGVTDVFDPAQNLRASARYLKQQVDRFGDFGLALGAYNWGPENIQGMISNPGRFQPPDETAKYVPGVFRRSANFGEPLAPSTPTLAFFPGTTGAAKDSVTRSVKARTGASDIRRVENLIQTGQTPAIPTRGGAARGDEFSPPVGGIEQTIGAPSIGVSAATGQATDRAALAAAPGVEEFMQRTVAAPQAKSIHGYLRKQFGPLADVADPLPKTYDSDLLRMIDEA